LRDAHTHRERDREKEREKETTQIGSSVRNRGYEYDPLDPPKTKARKVDLKT